MLPTVNIISYVFPFVNSKYKKNFEFVPEWQYNEFGGSTK